MPAIFGYTLLNDISARDVQFKDNQITIGKNFAGFAPIGPCIVTADELPHPDNVRAEDPAQRHARCRTAARRTGCSRCRG